MRRTLYSTESGRARYAGRPAASTLAVAVLALALLPGCSLLQRRGAEPTVTSGVTSTPTSGSTTPSQTPTTSAGASDTTAAQSGVPLSQLTISLAKVASGFSAPLYVTNAGDGSGRLFVMEQTGRIRVVRNGRVSHGAFLDVSSLISSGGERGLLGLAFAPDYEKSGRFYVNYTDTRGNTVVARYVASPPSSDTPKLSKPTRLLYIDQPYPNHNGGCLQFGLDGMLYVGMGDGGSAGDPQDRAQNLRQPLGKLLRIDVSGSKYSVPKDNPYAKSSYPENIIVARGLRNPWRFSFDAVDRDLWIGDVGQDSWEEIDVRENASSWKMGATNFGWNKWEGNHPYPPGASRTRGGFQFPIVEYPHPTGESVTGGYVYRGEKFPAMYGTYFYADYVKGWIAGIYQPRKHGNWAGAPQTQRLLSPGLSISSFGVDEANELYLTDLSGGGVYQVRGRAK